MKSATHVHDNNDWFLCMNRQHITRRLQYLRNWEFFNIVLLPTYLAVVIISLELPTWLLYSYCLFVICFILAQGVLYWHLKLRALHLQTRQLPAYFGRAFTAFKRTNWILIAAYPLLVAYSAQNNLTHANEVFWATLLWIFAVLEQINYYYVQLMHDNRNDIRYLLRHKRLRPAPIASDLAHVYQ